MRKIQMKVDLNKKQLEFLNKKFGISKKDIVEMDIPQWNEVRLNCFEIEADELLDFGKTGKDYDDCNTEDYLLASSIIDLPYKI